jgi:hypothetical protein
MNFALAIAQVIIPLLPMIAGDVSDLVKWLAKVRAAAKQNGEWTHELDLKFRESLIDAGQDPAYSLDPEAGD